VLDYTFVITSASKFNENSAGDVSTHSVNQTVLAILQQIVKHGSLERSLDRPFSSDSKRLVFIVDYVNNVDNSQFG
jgi:hypothetical protein